MHDEEAARRKKKKCAIDCSPSQNRRKKNGLLLLVGSQTTPDVIAKGIAFVFLESFGPCMLKPENRKGFTTGIGSDSQLDPAFAQLVGRCTGVNRVNAAPGVETKE